MDCRDGYILLAYNALQLVMYSVHLTAPIRRNTRAEATLLPCRELSLLSISTPVLSVALLTTPSADDDADGAQPAAAGLTPESSAATVGTATGGGGMSKSASVPHGLLSSPGSPGGARRLSRGDAAAAAAARQATPTHCVVLRWGGRLSLLDMESGVETRLFEVRPGPMFLVLLSWYPCFRVNSSVCFLSGPCCRATVRRCGAVEEAPRVPHGSTSANVPVGFG